MRLLWVLWLAGAGCTGASSETDGGPDTEVPAVLLGIGVSPRDPVVGVGGTVRFAVKAYYDDASTVDVSKDVSWLTTEPGVAGIDPSGLAVGLEPGIAGIVATDERGVATRTELIVRGGVEPPTALVLSPRVVEMAVGEQVALAARATWADGEEGNVASSCAWSTDDGGVAAVDAVGLLSAVAVGRTTVRARCHGLDASAPVAVRAPDQAAELPDFVVSEVLLEATGDALYLLAEVRNVGEGMSPIGFVDLFLDSDGAPDADDVYVSTDIVDALGPGESALVELVASDLPAGSHTAWVVADADGWVAEADEANNGSGPHPFEIRE